MTILSQVFDYDSMKKITSEFSRLGEKCYLENAGAQLYPQSLLKDVMEDFANNIYMNPHSNSYTKDCIDQIRCTVLKHFNTDPSEYSVIFTSGTTQALKLTVESFQFASDDNQVLDCGSYIYLRDNHTSVVGLREIAEEKNADVIHISHDEFQKSLNHQVTPLPPSKINYKNQGNTLFAFPAENNFNGYKYPIDCIQNIKDGCLNSYIRNQLCKINCNWYVLLDAASFVPNNRLDLSLVKPDFVCMSFYKMFGYPSGLGALLVRNRSAGVLNKKVYFGGGTVDVVLSSEDYHVKRETLNERFEDGTLPFLSIIALKYCFDKLYSLIPRVIEEDVMETISHHTFYLAKDFYNQLKSLKHTNGQHAAILYMDSDFSDITKQGNIVTFNLQRYNGTYIGYSEFQQMANLFNISVRTGCFCNTGSCQRHLNLTNKQFKEMYESGHKCGDEIDLINGRPTGAIRVSFAYYNTFNDVDKIASMISTCYVKTKYVTPKRCANTHGLRSKNTEIKQEIIKIRDTKVYGDINIVPAIPRKFNSNSYSFQASDIVLKEMAIFPVKSCGAFKVTSSWKLGEKGFEFDREWMIIKDNGVCLTQKQNTRMCMIRPTIDLKKKLLILNFKGQPPISMPLIPPSDNYHKEAVFCQSKVCTDVVKGIDYGDEVADWISNALEVSYLRLIRQTDNRYQKKNNGDQKLLSLSNQAQFLLINKATVRWLKEKIDDPMFTDDIDQLTDRFRGNLIVDMDEELAELDWQRVVIGKHEFKVESQCSRCQMVCIDQQTGEKTVEPLRTISQQFGGKLRFGIYLSYISPVDGTTDTTLKNFSSIMPSEKEEDISRFKDWFCMYFLGKQK